MESAYDPFDSRSRKSLTVFNAFPQMDIFIEGLEIVALDELYAVNLDDADFRAELNTLAILIAKKVKQVWAVNAGQYGISLSFYSSGLCGDKKMLVCQNHRISHQLLF